MKEERMEITKERVLAEKAALEGILGQLETQAQEALLKVARAEGGIRALQAVLNMLDAPELEKEEDNDDSAEVQ